MDVSDIWQGGTYNMPRKAKQLNCTEEDIIKLNKIVNSQKSEQRMARREVPKIGIGRFLEIFQGNSWDNSTVF
jgi:hypothetical protein